MLDIKKPTVPSKPAQDKPAPTDPKKAPAPKKAPVPPVVPNHNPTLPKDNENPGEMGNPNYRRGY